MRFKVMAVLLLTASLRLAGHSTILAADSAGDSDSLIRFLPAGALGTAEVAGLAPLIDRVESSEALRAYLDSPLYEDALKTDPMKKAMAGKAIAEAQLGMSLWATAKTYLGDRIALAVYPPSAGAPPDGVLVVRVKESGDLKKLLEKLTPLISLAGDAISISDHDSGGKALKFKDGHVAILKDRWLILSKKPDLIGQTLGNLISGKESGLASEAAWTTMAQQVGPRHTVQVCVNLQKIGQLHGRRVVPEKLDNPVFSLLFGGVAELVAQSPYAGLTLDVRDNGFSVRTSVAGKAADLDDAHRALLVDPAQPLVPLIPGIDNRLGVISFSRSFARWYKAREKLLEAKILPEFDKFETGLATFIPGKDFGEDVLPLLTGRIAFVSAPQDYSYLDGKPGVQLPAFALVVELAKPREGSDILNLISQTILTVRNLEAAKFKHQPWVQASESYKDIQINFARYLQRPKGEQLETLYNFQPAAALVGNRFVLSSSLGLCRQLIDTLSSTKPAEAVAVEADRTSAVLPNFVQEFSPSVAAELLEANASIINAKNVQNGKTAEQAARELAGLCQLLRHLTTVRFDMVQYTDRVQLELHGGWK